jgi:hypothetical protein
VGGAGARRWLGEIRGWVPTRLWGRHTWVEEVADPAPPNPPQPPRRPLLDPGSSLSAPIAPPSAAGQEDARWVDCPLELRGEAGPNGFRHRGGGRGGGRRVRWQNCGRGGCEMLGWGEGEGEGVDPVRRAGVAGAGVWRRIWHGGLGPQMGTIAATDGKAADCGGCAWRARGGQNRDYVHAYTKNI